ncbi:TolC family protein [Methylosarcina fibrata]|uniref:TolC family protein n=1 Tax=Methylosarcina fibrata TaxID=105972 RepID=UPI00037B9489|nr:TolC family protein [Methylosarcina fibrata]
MIALNFYRRCLPVVLLTASASSFSLPIEHADVAEKGHSSLGGNEPDSIVSHVDPIEIDASLNLAKLIDLTLEKYPDATWLKALEEEAAAISERSQSWTAGASQASVGYETMYNLRLNYATGSVQVPLWNLGQRNAEQRLANEAETSAGRQTSAVKLRVAGLVRSALWNMALANIRYDQAKAELDIYEKLLSSIRRRVESGDLPRTDELLAQTEMLQKRSSLTLAEAELMHARKRYSTVTQMTRVPRLFEEKLAPLTGIEQNHPALAALNSQIERKQAELNATRSIGSGQTHVTAGILSDEGTDSRSNKAEFFNVGISVPFGGSAHLAPQIAAINVELNRLIADREQLYRDLEQAHHEAEHNLEVNRVELETANQQRKVSEELLKMTQLAFSVGEIDLMDLLRIQSRTQQAILTAKERAVMLQRDIALYNQAIGVLP